MKFGNGSSPRVSPLFFKGIIVLLFIEGDKIGIPETLFIAVNTLGKKSLLLLYVVNNIYRGITALCTVERSAFCTVIVEI